MRRSGVEAAAPRVARGMLALAACATMAAVAVRPAHAQMLGVPVLQNAFANPGFTVGLDFGGGNGAHAYGAAAAWTPTSRVSLSGGGAWFDPSAGSGAVTWGLRGMVPVLNPGSSIGVAPFVGIGGMTSSGVTSWRIPIGVSVGYRRALGGNRGISGYVAPFYTAARERSHGTTTSHGLMRVSLGVDVAVLPSLGVSVGYETGATAGTNEPGPTGGVFGVGLSYALQRHR